MCPAIEQHGHRCGVGTFAVSATGRKPLATNEQARRSALAPPPATQWSPLPLHATEKKTAAAALATAAKCTL